MNKLNKEQEQQRLELYKQGLKDKEIANLVGVKTVSIQSWRTKRKLKPNGKKGFQKGNQYGRNSTGRPKLSKEEHELRMKYYMEGLNDRQIGELVFQHTSTIQGWRKANNLKPNKHSIC